MARILIRTLVIAAAVAVWLPAAYVLALFAIGDSSCEDEWECGKAIRFIALAVFWALPGIALIRLTVKDALKRPPR